MRRSVREALVGFSLLAAISAGFGLWLWLRGVSFGRGTWRLTASFADAAGLAERSPVAYRGVLVGSVRSVRVTGRAVLAELEITDPDLRLARPVVARVGSSSMLGGDARVSLISGGEPLPETGPGPRDSGCDSRRMICQNAVVQGVATATLESVTATVQKLLDQAERDKLVDKMVAATASFEATAREAEMLSKEGKAFVAEANRLLQSLNRSAGKIDPILTNANTASAGFARASVDVASASRHIRNISATLDNPRTVADLQATLSNAKQLTDRWSAVGGDVRRLTDDPQFIDGIRNVSVGLGRFFQELYPAQTAAARERDERRRAEREKGSAGSPGSAGGPAQPSP